MGGWVHEGRVWQAGRQAAARGLHLCKVWGEPRQHGLARALRLHPQASTRTSAVLPNSSPGAAP